MSRAGLVLASGLLSVAGGDVRISPPLLRAFQSPAGSHVLEVRGTDGWKLPNALAELFSIGRGGRRTLWSKALPHRYGPWSAIVSDSGSVLLLDEWVKTPSQFALMLIDAAGTEIARYSMSDIAEVSGVPTSKLVTTARIGPWMSASPKPAFDRRVVMLEAGGVPLEIDLVSGRLTRTGI